MILGQPKQELNIDSLKAKLSVTVVIVFKQSFHQKRQHWGISLWKNVIHLFSSFLCGTTRLHSHYSKEHIKHKLIFIFPDYENWLLD